MSLCFEDTPKLATFDIYSSEMKDTLNEIVASDEVMLSGRLPAIEELTLDNFYLQACGENGEVDEVLIGDFRDFTLDHLRKVELRKAYGLNCEMQFTKLILAKSPVLENFFNEIDSKLAGDNELSFFKELATFRRASPLAEISYKW